MMENLPTERQAGSPVSEHVAMNGGQRSMPIIQSSRASLDPLHPAHTDPMDFTPPPSTNMGPPPNSSPEMAYSGNIQGDAAHVANGTGVALSAAAAASSQQPKVVQTAFIHKLYNMLEDPAIQHLISWSSSNESFVMSPSSDFSKVLSQYFKHTNISSFVRQLNMYGFHKVSDVFHTGSPEQTLWEFKHGNGNFKRGDLMGLREIKRRASRHALIHRDSFSTTQKPMASLPGTPTEPLADAGEVRIANFEHSLYDLHARLIRTEESNTALSSKCQTLTESLIRCHQWSRDIASYVSSLIPEQESQVNLDLSMMQKDITSQLDVLRSTEDPHESLLSGRHPYFSNMALENRPLSPRQAAQDERRASQHGIAPRHSFFRPAVPSHIPISPRRYGSIGTGNPSPNYHRPVNPQPPPPPSQHPLASVSPPLPNANLGRRHTSADIRVPNWPSQRTSPFASGQSSTHWPSSPDRTTHADQQHVRDVLAQYQIGGSSRNAFGSRQATPPLTNDTTPSTTGDSAWPFGASKFPTKHPDSASQTRRSSMASNVHSLLNPAETVERDEEDPNNDDRKRKRMQ